MLREGSRSTETMRLNDGWRLCLLGFLTLFVELVLIRYLAGNIWNLGYFPNLVLLAVFFGMGIGFVLHHHLSPRVSAWLHPAASLILLVLVGFVRFEHPVVPGFNTWNGEVAGELFFTATNTRADQGSLWVFLACFLAIVTLAAFVSQRTAKLFQRFPPLTAYTLDICGSCLGIVCFMAVSWLELPAYAWFVLLLPLFLASMEPGRSRRLLTALPLAAIVLLAWNQDAELLSDPSVTPSQVHWSPYQKIEFLDSSRADNRIFVNGISHQVMSPRAQILRSFYQIPYATRRESGLPPYDNVLVIGAGGGNDVVAALANEARHVDAVEIDPAIARLGRLRHPERPYDDPRVRLIVDDGRAFMTRADRRYDLIVFALTDSLVKVSAMAQIRLENYLFTEQSVRRAFGLLTATGDLVFYNYYRRPWLLEKLLRMLSVTTGREPEHLAPFADLSVLIVRRSSPAATLPPPGGPIDLPTDDWPFLYLENRGIPQLYLQAMAALAGVVALLLLLAQRFGRRPEQGQAAASTKLAFVLMGLAFLLLESKSVIQFSLLFGTTWYNSSLVFLAILLLVLAANWTVVLARGGRRAFALAYALLLGSCLLALVVPLGQLLVLESTWLRFVVASLMTFSPIFFANLLFSMTFRDAQAPEQIFGWNLVGATLGGIVEYSSMAIGYNALAVIVAICYTLAFGLLWSGRRHIQAEGRSPQLSPA